MGFIEFMFYISLLVYAARRDFWLNTPWINKNKNEELTEFKPTKQQNKVIDGWVRGVTHDQNKAA
ncbi:hypothetical protein AB0Y04_04895 [Loigolactobacillus coryniformis]|uniref:hypothetical protein n=1 Tax=Loigolactobacillus TaxID=2767889 RepID=UPI000F73B099|nr:hypothetical protein [Loigolactobacillus zhaoyuanensis]